MKGSSIISALNHLHQAKDFFEDFKRAHPASHGARLFEKYNVKIEWIYRDIITNPMLPREVIDGVKKEWASDCFSIDAIREKIALLNPSQREAIEMVIDKVLTGEEISVEVVK